MSWNSIIGIILVPLDSWESQLSNGAKQAQTHVLGINWSVDFLISTRRQDRNNGKNLLVYRILYFFGKSIAEWGHGWVVHRWFENKIFDILWFWREIYEFRKDHKMGYTEPFELAISRIYSPMSQLSSGKLTASNGASFGTLSAHFDDGLKMSKYKKSTPITQFYRFWHRFYVFL